MANERHTLTALVDNEAGVLARVVGLFSGRGYNIESLTVAEVDAAARTSRISIVTSGTPAVIEQMLTNMFVGRPPGNYDRLLDFSRAVTGNLFFVPSGTFLEEVTSDPPATPAPVEPEAPIDVPPMEIAPAKAPQLTPSARQGSLGIGSLKGDSQA